MNTIFLGPPGSGKGTMAERIAKFFNIAHVSTGDMLREEIKKETKLGALAKSYIDKGALVPDSVIIDMIKERLQKADASKGVLFDGFPRTVAQALALDEIAKIDVCVNLECDINVIVKRISTRLVCDKCGAVYSSLTHEGTKCDVCPGNLYTRPDDNEETVRERFKVYELNTAPLIDYYSAKIVNVDATMPIEEEATFIKEALKAYA